MCEPWCSLITSYTFMGETCIFVGKLHKRGRETVYPYNLTSDDLSDSSTLLKLAPLDQMP